MIGKILRTLFFVAVALLPAAVNGEEVIIPLPGQWKGVHIEGPGVEALVPVEYHFRKEHGSFIGEIARFDRNGLDIALIQGILIKGRVMEFIVAYEGGSWTGKKVRYELTIDSDEDSIQGWGYDMHTGKPFGVYVYFSQH